jgi:peptidoglycan hydrolase-like protein with peptidoglycan-binding domain
MGTEIFGVIALSLVLAACGSEGERNSISVEANGAQAAAPPTVSEHLIRQAQSELRREGLYRGSIDGIAGPETKQAITAFRQRERLQQTAGLDQVTMQRLRLKALRMVDDAGQAEGTTPLTEDSGSSMTPSKDRDRASAGR